MNVEGAERLRPRVKFEHRPVRHGCDTVRIGSDIEGIGIDVRDVDGWLWALLTLLDGSRTVEQVVNNLVPRFPAHPESHVRKAVRFFAAAGYLEDADEADPAGLSDSERDRYSRGHSLIRWMTRTSFRSTWEAQLRLRGARVTVIGVGGAGATAALALVMSGVGHVHCVDRDHVELSDLNRQVLYTERHIGWPKTDAAVERLREYNSDVLVTGEQTTIDGVDVLRRFAAYSDVLVLTADRPEDIRSWANQACHATRTPWVYGGYVGPRPTVGIYLPGVGPCYDCGRAAERERLAALPPRTSWSPSAGVAHYAAANAVTAGMAGHLIAHAAMSTITGIPELPTNCQYTVNLVTLNDIHRIGPAEPRPDCPTCGRSA
ncbi:HesA/MoeB/ThiF family protein [Lentzea cavernae]|uniref:Thiamine/molybdopterin biosynthesis protein n=1 Tax=Lentzea cavernae TaxID=2020703 RepID=A0ABQ3MFU4_9PSEU|nr:ThiF family adenylyltransferase [Lentzea cavernae]GHH42158.1 thiamine/molybdopterin biosynthesis protein [Lentzea cavernae]